MLVCKVTDAVKRPPNLSVLFFNWTLSFPYKTNSPSLFTTARRILLGHRSDVEKVSSSPSFG